MSSKFKYLVCFHVLSFVPLIGVAEHAAADHVIYVDDDAQKGGNGSSWNTAFNILQDALEVARAGDEIWVAAGTYIPAPETGGRVFSFRLKNNIALYGGFEGDETTREMRNWKKNQTILSGDIDRNDIPPFENNEDNSLHVVEAWHVNESAILDGFIISSGNANVPGAAGGDRPSWYYGGGLYAENATPTIANCIFRYNWAYLDGGGIFSDSRLTLTKCTITENYAERDGGGIANDGGDIVKIYQCVVNLNGAKENGGGYRVNSGDTISQITECQFIENSANEGGGVFLSGTAIVTNCEFIGNSATRGSGSAIRARTSYALIEYCTFTLNSAEHGGGTIASDWNNTIINNCDLINNHASYGGAIKIENNALVINTLMKLNTSTYGGAVVSNVGRFVNCVVVGNVADVNGGGFRVEGNGTKIINCTIKGNEASEGAGIYCYDGAANIFNSIIWGNTGGEIAGNASVVRYSCVENGYAGIGNIDNDPLFVDSSTGNFHLQTDSPCIDAAENMAVPSDEMDLDEDGDMSEPIPFDFDGNLRFVDDPNTNDTGNGSPPIVDMGAFEFQVQTGETADLTNIDVVTGEILDGTIEDLQDSDDEFFHTRSGFGIQLSQLHLLEMLVRAHTQIVPATSVGIIIESFIDDTVGAASIYLFNWNTNEFDRVGQYSIGLNEETITFEDIDATNYIRLSGAIELSIKHVVFVPFLAFQFDSFFDLVEITVE